MSGNIDHIKLSDEWCGGVVCPADDIFHIRSNLEGADVGGYAPHYGQFGGSTEDHSLIQNLVFPDPAVIPDFDLLGGLNFLTFGSFRTVRWEITSLDVVVTPEPSTALLMALGLAWMGGGGRARFGEV